MFQDRVQQVQSKIAELIAKAEDLYKIKLPSIDVRFDLRGRSAGQAIRRNGLYSMRFNRGMMLNESWDHMINDTVPHELAHVICFVTGWDFGHGARWRAVCRGLGGTGNRCHSEEVQYANGNTYYYTTSTGFVAPVSQTIHRRIQGGQVRMFRDRSKGVINKTCAWSTAKPGEQSRPAPQPVLQPVLQLKGAVKEAKIKAGAPSKADQVRARIAFAKQQKQGMISVIIWAVDALGMTKSLARTYVENNWDKA